MHGPRQQRWLPWPPVATLLLLAAVFVAAVCPRAHADQLSGSGASKYSGAHRAHSAAPSHTAPAAAETGASSVCESPHVSTTCSSSSAGAAPPPPVPSITNTAASSSSTSFLSASSATPPAAGAHSSSSSSAEAENGGGDTVASEDSSLCARPVASDSLSSSFMDELRESSSSSSLSDMSSSDSKSSESGSNEVSESSSGSSEECKVASGESSADDLSTLDTSSSSSGGDSEAGAVDTSSSDADTLSSSSSSVTTAAASSSSSPSSSSATAATSDSSSSGGAPVMGTRELTLVYNRAKTPMAELLGMLRARMVRDYRYTGTIARLSDDLDARTTFWSLGGSPAPRVTATATASKAPATIANAAIVAERSLARAITKPDDFATSGNYFRAFLVLNGEVVAVEALHADVNSGAYAPAVLTADIWSSAVGPPSRHWIAGIVIAAVVSAAAILAVLIRFIPRRSRERDARKQQQAYQSLHSYLELEMEYQKPENGPVTRREEHPSGRGSRTTAPVRGEHEHEERSASPRTHREWSDSVNEPLV